MKCQFLILHLEAFTMYGAADHFTDLRYALTIRENCHSSDEKDRLVATGANTMQLVPPPTFEIQTCTLAEVYLA